MRQPAPHTVGRGATRNCSHNIRPNTWRVGRQELTPATTYSTGSVGGTRRSTNWMNEATVTVTAVQDGSVENRGVSTITHSASGGYASVSIGFNVVDGDTAGVFVDESNGSTT